MLVYVEYCQRGQPLLTHSASKVGFQSLHVAKTAFDSAGLHKCLDHHRCHDWVLNSHINMNSVIFTSFSFRKIAAIIRFPVTFRHQFDKAYRAGNVLSLRLTFPLRIAKHNLAGQYQISSPRAVHLPSFNLSSTS